MEIGSLLTDLGYGLMLFSFFAYLLFRPLSFLFKSNAFKFVKAFWYFSMGLGLLVGEPRVETVVMLLAFIEGYDLIFQYFEGRRVQKTSQLSS